MIVNKLSEIQKIFFKNYNILFSEFKIIKKEKAYIKIRVLSEFTIIFWFEDEFILDKIQPNDEPIFIILESFFEPVTLNNIFTLRLKEDKKAHFLEIVQGQVTKSSVLFFQ